MTGFARLLKTASQSTTMHSVQKWPKLKMASFVLLFLILYNCFTCAVGSQSKQHVLENKLEITPSILIGDQYIGTYEVEDNLNLTCIFPNEFHPMSVVLKWTPMKAFNRAYLINNVKSNSVNLVIQNLTENDSGVYTCEAYVKGLWITERSIDVYVKIKKGECSETMFQCSYGRCIPKRFTCDGYRDCSRGEDEMSHYCGQTNPCESKLRCPDGRCIPYEWCCDPDRDRNCTSKGKPSCCIHMEKLTRDIDSDLGFQHETHEFKNMGFLYSMFHTLNANSTAVFAVAGCILVFTFMMMIKVVISPCRTCMRRSVTTHCPVDNRRIRTLRSSQVHSNRLNSPPLYDADVHFNRSDCGGNSITPVNSLQVTYNISNGIQFVGRPIDPPPYCEILTSPPREGPPPPYASQENLCSRRRTSEENEDQNESIDPGINSSESNALLGSDVQNEISVISCNAIDTPNVGEHSEEVALHAAEEAETSGSPVN